MGSSDDKLINRQTISDLLYGEEEYIQEFSDATIDSYTEFLEKYRTHLQNRDLEKLREAGHKIKPVSQMLNLSVIIEEYEHAKTLLEQTDPSDKELEDSINRMEGHVDQIIHDLDEI